MITDSLGLVALAMGSGAGTNPTLARTGKLSRLIDWLGSARRHNERINDEMETLKFEIEVLRWAHKHLCKELDEARPLIQAGRKRKEADKRSAERKKMKRARLRAEINCRKEAYRKVQSRRNAELIESIDASLAAYELKRGRAHG